MALIGVDNAGDTAESASTICRCHLLELCCNNLLSLNHNEGDNLSDLFFGNISYCSSSSDHLNEYLTPLLSSLHLFAFMLNLFVTEYFAELLILIFSSVLLEVCMSCSHENLLLDPLSLAPLLLFLPTNFLTTVCLGSLTALNAPLLDFFGLKFGSPTVSLSTVYSEEGHALLYEESKGSIVSLNKNIHCFID